MTASWADLFERAASHEVTLDRIRATDETDDEAGQDGGTDDE